MSKNFKVRFTERRNVIAIEVRVSEPIFDKIQVLADRQGVTTSTIARALIMTGIDIVEKLDGPIK